VRDWAIKACLGDIPVMTPVIKNMTRDIFIYVSNEIRVIGEYFAITLRSKRQNSVTCNKGPHGKRHRRKLRNERKTSRRNPRPITIRHKQVHHKKQRKHPNT